MKLAIEASGLTKIYDAASDRPAYALNGVDLAVPDGQVFDYGVALGLLLVLRALATRLFVRLVATA